MSSFIKPKKTKKVVTEEKVKISKPIQTIIRSKKSLGLKVNKTDLFIPRQVFKNVNVVERKIETKELDHIEFTFLSDEEILEGSVTEITETIFGGPKSLYDMKMGPVTTKDTCVTCEGNWEECPGHFGHIPLAVKIPHPILYKKILDYLKIFCMECKKLVITDKRLKIIGVNKLKNEQKFQKIIKDVNENIDCCMHCKAKMPVYTFLDDKYIKEIGDKKLPVTYDEISNLFYNIREKDVEKLGLDAKRIHPSHYIISNLLVVPTCVRPPVVMSSDSRPQHDDLTYKYIDILKTNKKIAESNNETTLYNLTNNLIFHIKTLFNNSKGKARDLQGIRPIKCIKKRISYKTGLIRKHIQGKRSDFCGRTVIGPEANCMVDEIVIPRQFAENLTYPVTVNDFNRDKCQQMLEDGKVIYIFRDGKKIIARYACWTEGTQWREGDYILRDNKQYLIDNFISRSKTLPHDSLTLKDTDKIVRVNYTENNKKHITYEPFIMPKRKEFLLKPGDIIERKLQNGDWVVLNRQPTLWKGSMRAKKVVIRPGNTIRFNLASTAAFNADFDGDEMNIWVPQSEQTKAECATILSTSSNFLSSQDSKPLIGLKQDGMTGGYLLTFGYQPIDKAIFMEILTTEYFELSDVFDKFEQIKLVHKREGFLDKRVNEIKERINKLLAKLEHKLEYNKNLLKDIKEKHTNAPNKQQKLILKKDYESCKQTIERLKSQIEDTNKLNNEELITEKAQDELLYTGHSLFSFLLQNDLEYTCDNKISPDNTKVYITRGVLLTGTLNKVALGNSSGSLIHHIAKDYGSDAAIRFVSYYEMMINNWLIHRGFSIGMSDCIPKDTDLIEKEINKYMKEATVIMNNEQDKEILETKVNNKLNNAATIGQKIAAKALEPTNNLVSMIRSGAKGNLFNICQVTGLVGQQNVTGIRIQKTFGGRTLPHYPRQSYLQNASDIISKDIELTARETKDLFESRGFVTSSFFKGLNPKEFFFHAAGGREGLIDTACKTADTGYIQRKIIKMIEDCYFTYDGLIYHGTSKNIIEFMYGGDNMDASRLIKTSEGFSFIDISHTVDKLNKNLEWETK